MLSLKAVFERQHKTLGLMDCYAKASTYILYVGVCVIIDERWLKAEVSISVQERDVILSGLVHRCL